MFPEREPVTSVLPSIRIRLPDIFRIGPNSRSMIVCACPVSVRLPVANWTLTFFAVTAAWVFIALVGAVYVAFPSAALVGSEERVLRLLMMLTSTISVHPGGVLHMFSARYFLVIIS